jgi:peptidase A4-like protein
MHIRMHMRKFLSIAVLSLLAIWAIAQPGWGQPTRVVTFGPDSPTTPVGPAAVEFPITTAYAKAFALRTAGADVVARMIHRVEVPIGIGPVDLFGLDQRVSDRWGGYEADLSCCFTHRSTGAKGYFNASPAYGSVPTTGSWIGVGGRYGTANLLQAGANQKSLQAFTEAVPGVGPVYWFGIFAGDTMFAQVLWDSYTNHWFVLIEDTNTGSYHTTEYAFQPDTQTSDWETEVTVMESGPVPTFDPVTFWSSYWWDENGTLHEMASSAADSVMRSKLARSYGGCVIPDQVSLGANGFTNRAPSCLLP